MRHLAMTGMVTASWISRILVGSAMRATPPSRRMSAGTRSSAMTATAPASSAIRAWSASTTSMITPPLSISARPALTRIVPISCIGDTLPSEERLDGLAERVGLFDEGHVPGTLEDHGLGAADAGGDRARGRRAADEVVGAGDDERLGVDPRQVGAQVERLRVGDAQRGGVRPLDRRGEPAAVALVPAVEVERRHRRPHRGEVA